MYPEVSSKADKKKQKRVEKKDAENWRRQIKASLLRARKSQTERTGRTQERGPLLAGGTEIDKTGAKTSL